jgi:Flp pilus assembly protein TadG
MVEVAVVFPLVVMVALGLVQFALFAHAENVVTGAVQDGARVAAAADRTIADGMGHTQSILRAGLGPSAGVVNVTGSDDGQTVTIDAQGSLRLIIPWVGDGTIPLRARATVSKERFQVGPNG